MHVMMPIQAPWRYAIETGELVELCRHNIFEGLHEARIEQDLRQPVPQKLLGEYPLTFHESCRTVRR